MPGMGHCAGGTGCDGFDKLSELDHWVETGKAPERIVASKSQDGKVVRTHPLCAYPKVATGDLNDAANFACVSPQRRPLATLRHKSNRAQRRLVLRVVYGEQRRAVDLCYRICECIV